MVDGSLAGRGLRYSRPALSPLRNTLLTLTRQALGIGLRLGTTVLIARALGPGANGHYALALLIPTLLTGALSLGIPAANAHFVARGALGMARACQLNLLAWLALCTAGSLAAAAARASGIWLSDLSPGTTLIAVALFPVTLGASFAAGLLTGAADFAGFNRGLFVAPLCAAAGVLALAVTRQLTIRNALLCQLIAELASLAYLLHAVRAHVRSQTAPPASTPPSLGALLGFGGLAHLGSLLMLLNYRTDLLMLEWLVGPAAVGVYVIAARIAEQLWIVSQAMSSVLLPALSAESTPARDALIAAATRSALWVSGALALVIALLQPWLLLVFGPAYRAASAPLSILLPGAAALGGARIAGVAMTALGKPQRNLLIALAVLVCNVSLNLLLVPRYQERGAACATSVSYVLGCVVALGLLRPLTQVRLRDFLLPTAADLGRARRALGART